jgi:hypothetical protein
MNTRHHVSIFRSTALVAGLICAPALSAQPVIPPSPGTQTVGASSPASSHKAGQSTSFSNIASAFQDGLPLWRRGPVSVRPHLMYRFIHAEGLHATPHLTVDTSIQEISTAVAFEVGNYWRLHYKPTWTLYSHEFFADNFAHSVALTGGTSYQGWDLRLSEAYTTANSTLIETGGQTNQKTHATGLGVERHLGQRTSLAVDLNRTDRRVNSIDDDPQWTASDWLQHSASTWFMYRYSQRLGGGLGFYVGRDRISHGPDMSYSRPQAQLTWQPRDTLLIQVQGGAEVRKIRNANATTMRDPIYSASVEYDPIKATKFIVGASRSVSASYFVNRASRTTDWKAGLQQRLRDRFFLSLDFSERRTRYLAAGLGDTPGVVLGRDDISRSHSARLATPVLGRGSIAIFYNSGRNVSNILGYSFNSRQLGLELDYRF